MTPDFCSHCGGALKEIEHEDLIRRYCPECDRIAYRNPKPAAGVLVVDGDEVLLVQRTIPPDVGSWSVPAGYLEIDEPPAACAVRELEEETSVQTSVDALHLHDTVFVEGSGDHTILVVVYVAPRSATRGEPTPGSDAAAARFWDLEDLAANPEESIESGYRDVLRTATGLGEDD